MHPFQVQIYRPSSGLLIWEHINPPFSKKIPIASLLVVSQRLNQELSNEELCGNSLSHCATPVVACAVLTTRAELEIGKLLSYHLLERFVEIFGDELKTHEDVPALDLSSYIRFSNELPFCLLLCCQTVVADILRRERSVSYVLCAYIKTAANNYSILCSNKRPADVDDVDEVALLASIAPAVQVERRCFEQLKLSTLRDQKEPVITLTIANPTLKQPSLSLYTCGRLSLVIKHAKQTPPKDILAVTVPTLHALSDLYDAYKE
jgi:hypothetical protein